jgi:flagellar motor switch protein FliN/FliY
MEQQKPPEDASTIHWLAETWAACLAQAVEAMAGERPAVEPAPGEASSETPSTGDGGLWWEQGFDLDGRPVIWVGAAEPVWRAAGSLILGAAGVEDAGPEEVRGTWTEILGQAVSALAQAIGGRLERAVSAAGGREIEAPPTGEGRWQSFQLAFKDAAPAQIQAGFAGALLRALEKPDPGGQTLPARLPQADPEALLAQRSQTSRTLELLREIELPVSISFGRAEMALRDVLKLTAGSVVELDRSIDDPVELIVNDTVVALGEVVVVEGNYGLRIQKIMGRVDLLHSSGVV